jgi:hypothetical protein
MFLRDMAGRDELGRLGLLSGEEGKGGDELARIALLGAGKPKVLDAVFLKVF